jgi:hypothetical protein
MKIFDLIKGHKMGFLSFLLVAVAAALGADCSFAMAEAMGAPDPDVVDAKEGLTNKEAGYGEDDKGLNTVVDGAATATKADETEFSEEEIDRQIAQAFLFNFPLQYYIVNMARQQPVKTYHPKHFRSGSAKLDLEVKTEVKSALTGTEQVVTLTAAAVESNFRALKVYSTVFFRGVQGYDPKTNVAKGDLMGYVISTEGGSAQILILNPENGNTDSPAVATIAKGTKIFVGATAGSETQLVVPPDNYQPTGYEVYLQKKLSNIIWSKEWEAQAKKVDFAQKDLRNNALWIFKYKNAVAHWLGTQMIKNIDLGGDLGEERVYFEEGLLNQVNMMYSYDPDMLTPEDFNAIARMQFTRFSKNNHAVAFCGAGFLEKMQNMNVQKVQTVTTKSVEITGGLIVKRWDSIFGNIDFVYDPIFTELGYSDFAFICDIKELTRYVKREQKESTLDMEKTSDAREAKREMVSIIDCVATRGFNNILVGPSTEVAKARSLGSMEVVITQVDELPATAKDGDVVYLRSAQALYEYDADKGEWKDYTGAL